MNYKKLNVIDFSQGIKSKEVMENDLSLQEQIYRERLSVAGSGISYGLNLTVESDFTVNVSSGTLINNNGEEIYISGSTLILEKPFLNLICDERAYPTEEGKIVLKDTPYSQNRQEPSEFSPSSEWEIHLRYEDGVSNMINISNIQKNMLYTDARDNSRAVLSTYYSAKDRIDTVYMKNDYSIDIAIGTSSTTPTIYSPNISDCLYILGYVRIDHDTYDEDLGHVRAKCIVIDEYNNRRTVYTDSENNLYLCGNSFYGFSVIYYKEPKAPKEGAMWYDSVSNKFKVWRRTDDFIFNDTYTYISIDPNDPQRFKTSVGYYKNQLKIYKTIADDSWIELNDYEIEYYSDLLESEKDEKESFEFRIIPKIERYTKVRYTINKYDGSFYWIPINDTSFIQALEVKMWCPSEDNKKLLEYKPGLSLVDMEIDRGSHDLKTFIFKPTEDNLKFTPHKNELSIMINQIPLHRDQFTEITVDDILAIPELLIIAFESGYTEETLREIKSNNKEVGLGFKLQSSLDEPAFIEVNVTHRVNDSFLKNKLQRAATFNKKETIVYDSLVYPETNNSITINTVIPYQYGEGQLEVYINGKLINSKYVEELTNIDPALIGSFCNSFKIKVQETNIETGTEITYKITNNIYSYNHVESYFEDYLIKNNLSISGGSSGEGSHTCEVNRNDLSIVLNQSTAYTDAEISSFDGKYATRLFTNTLLDNKKIRVLNKIQYESLETKDAATIYIISENENIYINAGDITSEINIEIQKLKDQIAVLQEEIKVLQTGGTTPQAYTTDANGNVLLDEAGNIILASE